MKHEYHLQGDTIFDYGSVGDKFYLIIKGEVSVQIPLPTSTTKNDNLELEQKKSRGISLDKEDFSRRNSILKAAG